MFELIKGVEFEGDASSKGADGVQPKEVEVVKGALEFLGLRVEVEEDLPVADEGETIVGEVVGAVEGVPDVGRAAGLASVGTVVVGGEDRAWGPGRTKVDGGIRDGGLRETREGVGMPETR